MTSFLKSTTVAVSLGSSSFLLWYIPLYKERNLQLTWGPDSWIACAHLEEVDFGFQGFGGFGVLVFQDGVLHVALAVLELAWQTD